MQPRSLLLLLALPVLAACQDGRITIAVTDAPVDGAEELSIRFTGVAVERDDGEVEEFDFSPPRDVDLLALEGGARRVLVDEGNLDPDSYRAVRLRIRADGDAANSFIVVDGAKYALEMADEDAGRLRVAHAFSLERDEDLSLTVDFDLRKSVRSPDSGAEPYRLVPALRLVEDAAAGALAGTVAAETVAAEDCTPAVYVYLGGGITPDDVGSATEPLNSARVQFSDGAFRYRVGLLPAGSYTAAFTCHAADDRSDANDAIAFGEKKTVSVSAGRTANSDF